MFLSWLSWSVAVVVCSCLYLVLLARTILGGIFSALEFVVSAFSCWNSMLCPCFFGGSVSRSQRSCFLDVRNKRAGL